jgi:hypothetical protein
MRFFRFASWFAVSAFLVAPLAWGQSAVFVDKGQNAFGAWLGMQFNDDANSFGAAASYAYEGWIDASLAIYNHSHDDFLGADVSVVGIAPSVAVHFLKESVRMPVSAYGSLGFEYFDYSEDSPTFDLSGWSLTFSGGVYKAIPLSTGMRVIPQAALTFVNTQTTQEIFSVEDDETDSQAMLSLYGNFELAPGRGSLLWTVSPQVHLGDNTTFALLLGFVIP